MFLPIVTDSAVTALQLPLISTLQMICSSLKLLTVPSLLYNRNYSTVCMSVPSYRDGQGWELRVAVDGVVVVRRRLCHRQPELRDGG